MVKVISLIIISICAEFQIIFFQNSMIPNGQIRIFVFLRTHRLSHEELHRSYVSISNA